MKAFIYPYKPGSESSKLLSEALGIKRISHRNSKFKGGEEIIVINWGASKLPEEVGKCKVINRVEAVAIASNKLLTFQKINPKAVAGQRRIYHKDYPKDVIALSDTHDIFDYVEDDFVGELVPGTAAYKNYPGYVVMDAKKVHEGVIVRTPQYTDQWRTAQIWLNEGFTVVERHVLNGNSGEGIILREPDVDDDGDAPRVDRQCPLFVKYVPKKQEWRIHVCSGKAVDIQRKARRKDVADEDVNWKIRNHDNGFIFARNEGIECPQDVINQAVNAVKAIGLDFGAVDVIFNEKEKQAYVLEVNTAPGLSGSTLEGYTERFKDIIEGRVGVEPIVAVEAPQELVKAPLLNKLAGFNPWIQVDNNGIFDFVEGPEQAWAEEPF